MARCRNAKTSNLDSTLEPAPAPGGGGGGVGVGGADDGAGGDVFTFDLTKAQVTELLPVTNQFFEKLRTFSF